MPRSNPPKTASRNLPSQKRAFPCDLDSLYEAAVKALARRAQSTAEIVRSLEKKKADPKQIGEVLRRLKENGYLDDARFARSFACTRLENEQFGKERVRRDLKSRGVMEPVAQQAIGQAYQDVDEGELLRRYLKRRVNVPEAFSKPSKLVGLFRRLLRAGFASDTIVRELKQIVKSLESPQVKGRSREWRDLVLPSLDETLEFLAQNPGAESDLDK